MEKRYAIFDMDGTLVDSMGFWQELEGEFLRSKGIQGDLEPILEQTKPLTLREAAVLFQQTCGLEGTPDELIEEILALMEKHYRSDVILKPGVRPCLERLREQGVEMCVASATPEHLVRLCLERLGVGEFFHFFLSCVDVGAGKNRPDVFLEAARRLGARPEECAVFEDSVYAVRTAHAAGFHVVAVKDSPRNDTCWEEMVSLSRAAITDWEDFS